MDLFQLSILLQPKMLSRFPRVYFLQADSECPTKAGALSEHNSAGAIVSVYRRCPDQMASLYATCARTCPLTRQSRLDFSDNFTSSLPLESKKRERKGFLSAESTRYACPKAVQKPA